MHTQTADARRATAPLDPVFLPHIAALEKAAAERVAAGDLNGALRVIFDRAETFWTWTQERGCICGSELIDALCLHIGRRVRAEFRGFRYRAGGGRRRYVYVVSELYRDGGHTRVLEDLVAAHPGDDHHVLWVRGASGTSSGDVGEVFRVKGIATIHRLRGEPIETLRSGFRLLEALDADVLVHLGHPHDPITLALMQPSSARRLVMIHIADCGFALGRAIPDVSHVALGRHFQRFARIAWGLETAYLPMTCAEPAAVKTIASAQTRPFVTATSGSSHKFDLRKTPSYVDVLQARFAARDGTHVHYGPLAPEQLRIIDDLLDPLGWSERFVHVPHVPQLASAMIGAGVALYLDSYPIGGARAIVEAMAAGLPVCAASHDPNLDGASFCYPQALTWRTPDELAPLLARLDDAALAAHGAHAREFFVRNHARDVFVRRFDEITGVEPQRAFVPAAGERAG